MLQETMASPALTIFRIPSTGFGLYLNPLINYRLARENRVAKTRLMYQQSRTISSLYGFSSLSYLYRYFSPSNNRSFYQYDDAMIVSHRTSVSLLFLSLPMKLINHQWTLNKN